MQYLTVRKLFATRILLAATVVFTFLGRPMSGAQELLPALNNAPLSQPAQANRMSAGDTIVYVKEDGRELRLIQPDGSNDRLLWRVPDSVIGSAITSVAWRPDAKQIAFTSSHEGTCSEFCHDIYLINPDGSHLRRLTNAPACAELDNYPKGIARVQIENRLVNITDFYIYIEGVAVAAHVPFATNTAVEITFYQTADLGPGVMQSAVAIYGNSRWHDPAIMADVVAGGDTYLGRLIISGNGTLAYGASHVSWNPDGDRLAYQLGQGSLWQVGLDVPILGDGGPLLDPQVNNTVAGTDPDWSPVGNEVLYQNTTTSNFNISRVDVGATNTGTPLASVTYISGLDWFTDGSGFVVADDDALLSHTDLYTMTFADNSIGQLTQTSGHQAAAEPSMSPDDSQIVYTYAEDVRANPLNPQLRMMNSDGSGDHLLVAGGRLADWSRVAPSASDYKVFLPNVRR